MWRGDGFSGKRAMREQRIWPSNGKQKYEAG